MAIYIRNICTKNYQNLITLLEVIVGNVGDPFETQCNISKQLLSFENLYSPKNGRNNNELTNSTNKQQ